MRIIKYYPKILLLREPLFKVREKFAKTTFYFCKTEH